MLNLPQNIVDAKREGLSYLFGRRKVLFETITELYQEVITDRTYHVIRGAVNWASWDFSVHPWAVSIMTKRNTFRKQSQNKFNKMLLVLEVFHGIKDPLQSDPLVTTKLMDGVLDSILEDTVLVLELLTCIKDSQNNSLVMKYDPDETAGEVHDATATVQGLVFEITLDY